MVGISLSLGCYQSTKLTQSQKLGLRQLLLLEQKLKHPEFPDAVKGLAGMQIAHQMLQERESTGVLIGGLAEAVWNQQRKEEDLYKHKDVDVMVLDDHFEITEFEGGVDWWLPQKGKITLQSAYVSAEGVEKKWYKNCNGVILSFGAEKRRPNQLPPGLYIPDSEWVLDMRQAEAEANIDGNVEIDDEVFEKFRSNLQKRIKTRLPHFIREHFKDYILSPHYEKDHNKTYAVNVVTFDLETIAGIRGLKETEGSV